MPKAGRIPKADRNMARHDLVVDWGENPQQKLNTSKVFFLFNFPCMQVSFDGQKHIFWLFLLCLRFHTSAGMNIKHCCKIS